MSISTAETLIWLKRVLSPARVRLLEVGCGEGELAAELVQRGWEMVAIDLDPACLAAARARGVDARQADIAELNERAFDAVLFSRSLHHVRSLDGALEHARAALGPLGQLVCEEFALEAADAATAEWFYARLDALERGGQVEPDSDDLPLTGLAPLERWSLVHVGLHTGAVMLAAVRARFTSVTVGTVPYLYRSIAYRARDPFVPAEMLSLESAAIAAGQIQPVGLPIVAR